MWIKAASNKGCFNHVLETSVNTQDGCQALCESKTRSECVGISYSHKIGNTDYCYLCRDDTLTSVIKEFGFYRRPGTFKICLLCLINRTLIFAKMKRS